MTKHSFLTVLSQRREQGFRHDPGVYEYVWRAAQRLHSETQGDGFLSPSLRRRLSFTELERIGADLRCWSLIRSFCLAGGNHGVLFSVFCKWRIACARDKGREKLLRVAE